MAATRKLQSECFDLWVVGKFFLNHGVPFTYHCLAEIQQCLKKVEEGVELFDDIWEKVRDVEGAITGSSWQ
jgi:Not1 N-terminal domain, CCR4-Not complex component